jgi:hypothetical protein
VKYPAQHYLIMERSSFGTTLSRVNPGTLMLGGGHELKAGTGHDALRTGGDLSITAAHTQTAITCEHEEHCS